MKASAPDRIVKRGSGFENSNERTISTVTALASPRGDGRGRDLGSGIPLRKAAESEAAPRATIIALGDGGVRDQQLLPENKNNGRPSCDCARVGSFRRLLSG